MTSARLTERRLELAAALLLSLATLATAWAAYQSRQWTGEQSQGYSVGTAARINESQLAGQAGRQEQIDIATFIQWIDARAQRRNDLADFYSARFRPEFKPAFDAWLATRPFTNPSAPATPFAMPQYRLAATAQAEKLEARATAASLKAKDANQHADNYMLAVVLFASTAFLAGIGTKLHDLRVRAALLGLGWVVFLGTAIWVLATFPAKLTV